jgi:hypothetical protein
MTIGNKNPWDSDRKQALENTVETFEDVMRKHSIPPPAPMSIVEDPTHIQEQRKKNRLTRERLDRLAPLVTKRADGSTITWTGDNNEAWEGAGLPPLGEGHRDLPPLPRGEGYQTAGDPRFHALLKQIGDLHDKKQRDYGRDADAFANVRASQDFGVEAWIGCMIRAQDKLKRLQTYAQKGTLACEGVEDSFMDLAVYSLIGLILFRESIATPTQSPDR